MPIRPVLLPSLLELGNHIVSGFNLACAPHRACVDFQIFGRVSCAVVHGLSLARMA